MSVSYGTFVRIVGLTVSTRDQAVVPGLAPGCRDQASAATMITMVCPEGRCAECGGCPSSFFVAGQGAAQLC
jgi:hypothetical protein